MRILALLATYNEQRFIGNCLNHLIAQGIEVYLIDNGSTDDTLAIAERRLGEGVAAIETLPRDGLFEFRQILARKETLGATLEADWFIHLDADEIRLAPRTGQTLAEAIGEADAAGYNAINFQEFTFVPTLEAPDHDHDGYLQTMRWYYPFAPFQPHRLTAWKRQPGPVDLVGKAGHRVAFEGLRMCPQSFPMRHYLYLSVPHAIRKYAQRRHAPTALAAGWHEWREQLDPARILLPSQAQLRRYLGDDALDASEPHAHHLVFAPTRRSSRRA